MATGHHEDFQREERVEGGTDRSFAIVFGIVFMVVMLWPLLDGRAPRWWAAAVAAVFFVLAFAAPGLLKPLNRLWTAFGLLLNRIVSPLVLGLLFFLMITPIGLIMRLAGKDPLRLKGDRNAPSYWVERKPPGPSPDSMPYQF